MRYIISMLFLCGIVFAGDKAEWPPKPTKIVKELTSTLPTEAEIKKLDSIGQSFKISQDEKKRGAYGSMEGKLLYRLCAGNVKSWTQQDFEERALIADKMNAVRKKYMVYGASDALWGKWNDWAAGSSTHTEFFKRLLYGFKNKAKIHRIGFRQAVYKYMDGHKKEFPDLKAKLLFCNQLLAAGIQDAGIKSLPIDLVEEAKLAEKK